MLKRDDMVLASGAVRDQILALIRDHEQKFHQGQPCMGNRASLVAYIAHTLGVRDSVWDYASLLLTEYDMLCKDTACPHDPER